MVAPNFGRAMTRRRFDAIFSCISFSDQRMETGAMSSVQYRWALVNAFLTAINDRREKQISPSDIICVDESMVRWYGLGGHWIDIGLSFYSDIDRKPESGCEIKTATCTKSGIMIRLEMVTTAEKTHNLEYDRECNHGTAVICRLVEPWGFTNRHVCADSFFSSVQTAENYMVWDSATQVW